jgi:hypothetical protein
VEVEEKGRLESGTGERSGADRGESEVGAGSDDLGECHHSHSFWIYWKKLGPSIDRYPNGVCNGRPGQPGNPGLCRS